ncbi:MAG: hypothetical protein JXQ83_12975 [Candidatus Glassbacteria bacterium]|nr:hypothetical protein [Candidatus Glassbacteria bacterium]
MEEIYQSVLEKLPGVAWTVREYGRLTLEEYARDLYGYRAQAVQPLDDLVGTVSAYARRLLGSGAAALLERHFAETPVALTANHHGVDYKSLTVQGTIIFALPRLPAGPPGTLPVVPVLAFGTVPLNNFSFPRGIVLARRKKPSNSADTSAAYLKVPLIPARYSQALVSVAGPLTGEMVDRALEKVRQLYADSMILENEKNCLAALLQEEYGRSEVLNLQDYSDQAVVLNRAVWKRMFAPPLRQELPEMAYLEAERVAGPLIEKDLLDRDSLLHNLLFDPQLREGLLQALDKKSGCWDLHKLETLAGSNDDNGPSHDELRGCGTVFFWQVDPKGRRLPLAVRSRGSAPELTGVAGNGFSVPLAPEDLRRALGERRLLPCLFTSFAALAFARGVRCLGGFYQVDYLPAMQRGLLDALVGRGLGDWAQKVAGVPTSGFITGMHIALAHYPGGETVSAGAPEIIASGGLTPAQLEGIKALTVEEANLAGLLETYSEFSGGEMPAESWFDSLRSLVLERSAGRLAGIRL